MNVLAIIGSPKGKGSGYNVTRRIEERMQYLGHVEFEYLFLKDANVQPCRGCFVCVAQGENRCPLKDDRVAIEQRIEASDGVMLVSPLYVHNVSALMKNFIDRFAYTHHRPRFFDQKVLLVANGGGSGLKKTVAALRNALGGPKIVHELAYLSPPWPLADKIEAKQQRAVEKAAVAFYSALSAKERPVPGIGDLIYFKAFKHMVKSTKPYIPADYEYYKDKPHYFYDTKINRVKNLLAGSIVGSLMFLMKDMAPKPKEAEAK
jgi:multimeric flavodoxin WrbA